MAKVTARNGEPLLQGDLVLLRCGLMGRVDRCYGRSVTINAPDLHMIFHVSPQGVCYQDDKYDVVRRHPGDKLGSQLDAWRVHHMADDSAAQERLDITSSSWVSIAAQLENTTGPEYEMDNLDLRAAISETLDDLIKLRSARRDDGGQLHTEILLVRQHLEGMLAIERSRAGAVVQIPELETEE